MSSATAHVDPVTARYVEALFRLATRSVEIAAVQTDVDRIAGEVASPRVTAYLFDERVDLETRRGSLAPLLDGCSATTRHFVNLLFDKRREGVLRGLGAAWRRRALEERGAVEGVVESARPLGPGELAELSGALGRRLHKEVLLENEIRTDLLAGVRITVGGWQLDNTAVGRLEGLRRRMLAAPVGAAAGAS